jgi:hypothetical protein
VFALQPSVMLIEGVDEEEGRHFSLGDGSDVAVPTIGQPGLQT